MNLRVDGTYVTNQARKMFWEDKELYDTVIDYLLNFLVCDDFSLEERKSISKEILEGKKKLVGVNSFDLVEDGEMVKIISPISIATRKYELLKNIEKDMSSNIKNYIDFFAMDKSWLFFVGTTPKQAYEYAYTSADIIADKVYNHDSEFYFIGGRPHMVEPLDCSLVYDDSEKDFLDHGAYLVNNPKLIKELIGSRVYGGNIVEFYEKLYDYWENSKYKDHPRVKERQNRYLKLKNRKGTSINTIIDDSYNDERYQKMFKSTWDDEFESEFGIIDLQGHWYNCEWGGHALKAAYILRKNPDNLLIDDDINKMSLDRALDIIVDSGYVLIRDVLRDSPHVYAKRVNSLQKQRIESYCNWFGLDDISYEII